MRFFQTIKILTVLLIVVSISNSENVIKEHSDRKPSEKEIITAVFSLTNIKLEDCKSCNNVGTDMGDTTIGQYIAGFLNYFTDTSGVNYLDIKCNKVEPRKSNTISSINKTVWVVDFNICRRKASDNDIWCWGLRFQMDSTLQVIKGSLMCIGSG